MSGLPHRAWRSARWRKASQDALFGLPWMVVMGAAMLRFTSLAMAIWSFVILMLALVLIVHGRWRQLDFAWFLHQLNAQRPDLEDSADLLGIAPDRLSEVQVLQRARLHQRLTKTPARLQLPWPWRVLLGSFLMAMIGLAAIALWPRTHAKRDPSPAPLATPIALVAPHLQAVQLSIQPPAYTGLTDRVQAELSAQAPQGSQLRWRLMFEPEPKTVSLSFLDGRTITLEHTAGQWTATHRLDTSVLYRLAVDGVALDTEPLHRLDAIADRAPRVRVLEPAQGLNFVSKGQRSFVLAFEAEDDHALATTAELVLRLAQGSGENIRINQSSLSLRGEGQAKSLRFSHRLDLSAIGMAEGDDLIAQLRVTDTRPPQPLHGQSASVILRWPKAARAEGEALEGAVRRVLPAYFRSQRQIIIDAEALQQQKPGLQAGVFLQRSDGIGVDQRVLRLRYGQFLGEEADGAPSDVDAAHDDHDGHAHDNHESGEDAGFGQIDNVLETFGHTHDEAEAATLLDPETRALLKKALDQMWQSELHLRQGQPDSALPFAYRALGFIKQVQQAERVYLARAGSQLPPIDQGRRLSGKRDGIAARADALQAAPEADTRFLKLWQGLAPHAHADDIAALLDDALNAVLQAEPDVGDPLALQAAIDEVQRRPECEPCRTRLRALLWPLLAQPAAQVPRHTPRDAEGARYLDALQRENQP